MVDTDRCIFGMSVYSSVSDSQKSKIKQPTLCFDLKREVSWIIYLIVNNTHNRVEMRLTMSLNGLVTKSDKLQMLIICTADPHTGNYNNRSIQISRFYRFFFRYRGRYVADARQIFSKYFNKMRWSFGKFCSTCIIIGVGRFCFIWANDWVEVKIFRLNVSTNSPIIKLRTVIHTTRFFY